MTVQYEATGGYIVKPDALGRLLPPQVIYLPDLEKFRAERRKKKLSGEGAGQSR